MVPQLPNSKDILADMIIELITLFAIRLRFVTFSHILLRIKVFPIMRASHSRRRRRFLW